MAYDEGLAERITEALGARKGITQKRMFGGLCFLLHGNMFAGIVKHTLMLRIGAEAYPAALRKAHVREMDFTGRPMKGYVFVDPKGFDADAELKGWLDLALAFVGTLPRK